MSGPATLLYLGNLYNPYVRWREEESCLALHQRTISELMSMTGSLGCVTPGVGAFRRFVEAPLLCIC